MNADAPRLNPLTAWWWLPRARMFALGIIALLSAAMIWLAGYVALDHGLARLELTAQRRMLLHIGLLDDQLARYSSLPALLSHDSRLTGLLANPADRGLIALVNGYLESSAETSGALDIYLMDRNGNTIAASNWRDEKTFIGQNFSFRPYFQSALRGSPGRYFALGTTSGVRGYYFSHPVLDGSELAGVLVVKIDIARLEREWVDQQAELLVTDRDGVIFISSNRDWLYRSIAPLEPELRTEILMAKRYPGHSVDPLPLQLRGEQPSGARLIEVDGQGNYLQLSAPMPEAGWEVHLLADILPIQRQAGLARLLTGFFCGMAVLLLIVYLQRVRRRYERARHEEEKRQAMADALSQLEERVEQRTADLSEANALLLDEVRRHEATQGELIQATKLAALGQLSAGINHELNQPLAAIRTFSDNARMLIERGRVDEARHNLMEISQLTERMAQISAQLKVFSRKTRGERNEVSLRSAIDGALRILAPKIREAQADVSEELPTGDIMVLADMVQLEQVLVNLIGNALNVLEGRGGGCIRIAAQQDNGRVSLQIRDNGPGIPQEHLLKIFDPFFTTRDGGLGLGLSISHRIIERLEGQLTAHNDPAGGACFTVDLEAA